MAPRVPVRISPSYYCTPMLQALEYCTVFHALSLVCVVRVQEYALKVIEETNQFWSKLVQRKVPSGELSLV